MTPLHWAVQNEHVQICRYLFSSGANPSLLNGHGQSVYEMKTSETVQVLLKNEPTVSPLELEQQLLEAAKNSDIESIKVKRRERERRKKRRERRREERTQVIMTIIQGYLVSSFCFLSTHKYSENMYTTERKLSRHKGKNVYATSFCCWLQ